MQQRPPISHVSSTKEPTLYSSGSADTHAHAHARAWRARTYGEKCQKLLRVHEQRVPEKLAKLRISLLIRTYDTAIEEKTLTIEWRTWCKVAQQINTIRVEYVCSLTCRADCVNELKYDDCFMLEHNGPVWYMYEYVCIGTRLLGT